MRYPSLSPSFDAGAQVVFEALAATVEVESRPDDLKLSRRIQNLVPLPVMLSLALLVLVPAPAGAASFAGTQTGPTEWTYTLTFDPLDNYAVCPPPGDVATITLSGLAGVVAATRPTSTDFPASLDSVNLMWMPQVSNGGTIVTWTHQGPGTGNFDIPKHTFDFKVITGAPAVNGTVNVASDGFSRDVSAIGPCPVQSADDRDFTGTTNGPVGSPPPSGPVCGDDILDPGEQCDDGNDVDGDGCSSTCQIDPLSDLSLAKTDAPDPVTVGTNLTYTITVTNNGPSNATGVTVTDPLPGGVTFVSATPSRGTCSGTATVTCPLGGLANGESATVAIVVTPTSTGELSNTASVAGEQDDTNPGNNSDTETTSVIPIPTPPPPPPLPTTADLALSLMDTPDPLTVNGQLTYTITVTNNGPGAATGVQVVDSLPPGAVLAGPAFSSQGECSGTETVVCNLGTLPAGAHNQATVTINVIPTVTGGLSNTAHVTAVEPDPDHANNSRPETTTVEPEDPATADLAITATVEPRASGQEFTYTLRVTNNGTATATGVQLTNDLPRGIALGPATASQANCSDTDPMLCNLGELPSGATAEPVIIHVIRTEMDTLPNRAAVNGDQFDPNSGNNVALTSAIDVPTPKTTCNSKRCRLRLTCNLSDLLGGRCENRVTLFVDTRARRQSNQRVARPGRLVRFAAAIRNFPGGQTTNVPLKLTPKGRKAASMLVQQGRKSLRGEMRITNAAGGIDIIRLTVRLR